MLTSGAGGALHACGGDACLAEMLPKLTVVARMSALVWYLGGGAACDRGDAAILTAGAASGAGATADAHGGTASAVAAACRAPHTPVGCVSACPETSNHGADFKIKRCIVFGSLYRHLSWSLRESGIHLQHTCCVLSPKTRPCEPNIHHKRFLESPARRRARRRRNWSGPARRGGPRPQRGAEDNYYEMIYDAITMMYYTTLGYTKLDHDDTILYSEVGI